jgi:phytoene desaturase
VQTKTTVIGAGFAGMAAAASLAGKGHKVRVFEKNDTPGGRARMFKAKGFSFDMGPSWYWMPEVFENFYRRFGHTTSDFYVLKRLDPSYRVFFGSDDIIDMPADYEDLKSLFESIESGSAHKLDKFLAEAAFKYEKGMNKLVHKPSHSMFEFVTPEIVGGALRLQLFSSISHHIAKYFKSEKIRRLLEFPVLFLGAKPEKTPALYSLMNYTDLKLGTWYPMGGMVKISEAFAQIAREQGVEFHFSEPVEKIVTQKDLVRSVITSHRVYETDYLISGADYHHTEQELLESNTRNYTLKYWNGRTMAPSSLLFYLGVSKKIPGLLHHNLFFDAPFAPHAEAIYEHPAWPEKPLFYVCMPSATDTEVAPEGQENLFILMPIAPDLHDGEEVREKYFQKIMDRLESLSGTSIRDAIVYKKSYAVSDFKNDYNSFKGNAYGLANTLKQTAFLKPKLKNKHLHNMYYAGQLTTPGPGMPPSIISGQVAAAQILKQTT